MKCKKCDKEIQKKEGYYYHSDGSICVPCHEQDHPCIASQFMTDVKGLNVTDKR